MAEHQRANVLNEALTAFDRGTQLSGNRPTEAVATFRHAADLFESLIADGVHNGKLYYNLGNTYLRVGHLGKAILNYRRAENLIGSDAWLQHNLRYARSLGRTQIEPSGQRAVLRTAFFWHYGTSVVARYTVALVAYVVFWLLMTVRTFGHKPGLRTAVLAAAILWLTVGTSVAIETIQDRTTGVGVTVVDDIVIRKGNGEGYEPQFAEPIHEGVEFTLIEQRGGWYRIELPDGSTGWLREHQADLV